MPLYDYACWNCDHKFETKTSIESRDDVDCPECGAPNAVRLFDPKHMPPVYYHGTGWAKKDRVWEAEDAAS